MSNQPTPLHEIVSPDSPNWNLFLAYRAAESVSQQADYLVDEAYEAQIRIRRFKARLVFERGIAG